MKCPRGCWRNPGHWFVWHDGFLRHMVLTTKPDHPVSAWTSSLSPRSREAERVAHGLSLASLCSVIGLSFDDFVRVRAKSKSKKKKAKDRDKSEKSPSRRPKRAKIGVTVPGEARTARAVSLSPPSPPPMTTRSQFSPKMSRRRSRPAPARMSNAGAVRARASPSSRRATMRCFALPSLHARALVNRRLRQTI